VIIQEKKIMKLSITFLITLFLLANLIVASEYSLVLSTKATSFQASDTISVQVEDNMKEDMVWDTYLYFRDWRQTPVYITYDSNSLTPKPLQMLPREIRLKPVYWSKSGMVELHLVLCKPDTQNVLAYGKLAFKIISQELLGKRSCLPSSAQLQFVPETADVQDTATRERYTDYKQWDGRWANDKLGFSERTIRQAGCAISSAGNIIGWTPRDINEHLKKNGGYVNGNLLVWSKVPHVRFHSWTSMADSHFQSYHVIADLGGHFVLLTGLAGAGKYHSHDPGKNYNPVYSKDQIRSVRLYNK
jgi:hypothetical protein